MRTRRRLHVSLAFAAAFRSMNRVPRSVFANQKRFMLAALVAGITLSFGGPDHADAKGKQLRCTPNFCTVSGAIQMQTSSPPGTVTPGASFPITFSGEVIAPPLSRRCEADRRVKITVFTARDPFKLGPSQYVTTKTTTAGDFAVTVQYTAQSATSEKWDAEGFPNYRAGAESVVDRRRFKGKRLYCGEVSHLSPGGSGIPAIHSYTGIGW